MRITLPLIVAAAVMIVAPTAFAQSPNQQQNNSGAGVAGMPGNKSGPAMNKSGKSQMAPGAPHQDASKVQGMPGNKSGPAARPPRE